ncbi:MAG: HAMP domain-containing histidine kinase [Myxococcales bacterium FL481]|nr:MAG: HAMP domain-containing histidine kinase [Myxococcales bacterium FL481]
MPRSEHATSDSPPSLADVAEQMTQLVHDLRNPVGAVSMAIELLQGPFAEHLAALPEPARDQVHTTLGALAESSSQLRHLVEDLTRLGAAACGQITVARAVAAKRPVVPLEPPATFTPKTSILGLRDLLGRLEILTVTRSSLPALLAVDCAGDVQVEVNGPELLRALSNLVENAIEASAAAAPSRDPWTVWIRVRDQDNTVCIDVSNLGHAPPDEVMRWLEAASPPAAPAPASSKAESGLHGVGLPIVRRVAEQCGGRLVARHRDGTTVMTLQLPAIVGSRAEAS